MRIISDVTVCLFFTNSIFCECFSIKNLYTRIVERNNDFFKKKNLDLPYYHLKQTLANVMSFFINKCIFAIGNLVFQHDTDTLMSIDPVTFWANLFFYFFEAKYINNGSYKGYKYHGASDSLMTFVLYTMATSL